MKTTKELALHIKTRVGAHKILCAHFVLKSTVSPQAPKRILDLRVGYSKKDFAELVRSIEKTEADKYRFGTGTIIWADKPGVYATIDEHLATTISHSCGPMVYSWVLHECPQIYPALLR